MADAGGRLEADRADAEQTLAGNCNAFGLCSPELLKSWHESHAVDEPEESVAVAEEQRNRALMGTVRRSPIPLEMQRAIAMWTRKQRDVILWCLFVWKARDSLRAPAFFFVDAPDVSADGTTKVGNRGKRRRTRHDAQFHSSARWTAGSRDDFALLKSPSISESNQTVVSGMSLFHTSRRGQEREPATEIEPNRIQVQPCIVSESNRATNPRPRLIRWARRLASWGSGVTWWVRWGTRFPTPHRCPQ